MTDLFNDSIGKRSNNIIRSIILAFLLSLSFVAPANCFEEYFDITNGSLAEDQGVVSLDQYGLNNIRILNYSFARQPGLLGPGFRFDFEKRLMRDIGDYLLYLPLKCKNDLFYFPYIQFRPIATDHETEVKFQSELNQLASAAMHILNNSGDFQQHAEVLNALSGNEIKDFESCKNLLENDGPLRLNILAAVTKAGLLNFSNSNSIIEWRGNGSRILKVISDAGKEQYMLCDKAATFVFNDEGLLSSYRKNQAYPEVLFNRNAEGRIETIVSCGNTSKVFYSGQGRITKIERNNDDLFSADYDARGNLARLHLFNKTPVDLGFDHHNRLISTNTGEHKNKIAYDKQNRLVSIGSGRINSLYLEYKNLSDGLIVYAYKGTGAYYLRQYTTTTTKTSRKRGFTVFETVTHQAMGNKGEFYFDANWSLVKSLNTYYPVDSSYDEDGFLTSITAEKMTDIFSLCPLTKKTLEMSVAFEKTKSFKYDTAGRLIYCKNGIDSELDLIYDDEKALVPAKAVYKNGPELLFKYNNCGLLGDVEVKDKFFGRLKYSTQPDEPARIEILNGRDESVNELKKLLENLQKDIQGSDLELINLDF